MFFQPNISLSEWLHERDWASHWWFPVACLYAAIMVPLSLGALLYQINIPALAQPGAHAQHLLSGFTLALITGYLCGKTSRWQLLGLLTVWATARIAPLSGSPDWLGTGAQTVFACSLLWLLLPRFARAKRWSNLMLVPLLGLLAILAVASNWLIAQHNGWYWQRHLGSQMLLLLALLMMFMGGRSLAPAITTAHQKRGIEIQARLQPGLEGWLIATIGCAALLGHWLPAPAGLLLVVAGFLCLTRLWRWQVRALLGHAFISGMLIGYLWLAVGLIACGLALICQWGWQTSVHMISTGALGTLSCCIMLRSLAQRLSRSTDWGLLAFPCLMITLAACARVGADLLENRIFLLWIAAICWSLAYLWLAWKWSGIWCARPDSNRRPTA